MEEKQDGPEKSLFNSTERGQIQQPPAPPRDDRPAAEKYPPRDDKPGLYSLYDGDVHKDTFTTAAQAWEEFQKYGGKDVSIQPEFGGEHMVIRRERTVENQVWSGERKEFDVKVSDNFKRDLVAEGRNPDNPREPLPVAPKREASHTVLDQYDAQQADPTAAQLIAREQGQSGSPARKIEPTTQEPPRRHVDALRQALSPSSTSVQAMFAKGRVSASADTVPPEVKMLMAATRELQRAAPSGVPDALVRMFAASPPLSKPDAPGNSPSLTTLLDPPQRRHSLSHCP
jgi:hypothetical protein